jgi:hypothetical protein
LTAVVGVGSSSASSKKPVVKRKRVPKVAVRPPVTKAVVSVPTAADPLGRDYCGDANVVVRVPVTTIPCQSPLPDEQLATKEALLAAYERYWVTFVAIEREDNLAKSQFKKILVGEAYDSSVAFSDARNVRDNYWVGTRADVGLLNTRIRSLSSTEAYIEDCITVGGFVRSLSTGKVLAGTDRVGRLERQFTAVNVQGVWLFSLITLSRDGSDTYSSTCTSSDK